VRITFACWRVGCRESLPRDETAAMLAGPRLLGEVAMSHRKMPPFDALQPALRDFIMVLKDKAPRNKDAAK